MNKEELLKPRYKIIADYPGNSREVGFVFTMDKQDSEGYYTTTGYLQEMFFTQYPHLFKRLEWWEERMVEDMPTYVKFIKDYMDYKEGSVYKHEHWTDNHNNERFIQFRFGDGENDLAAVPAYFNQLAPASEQEYNDYTTSKK